MTIRKPNANRADSRNQRVWQDREEKRKATAALKEASPPPAPVYERVQMILQAVTATLSPDRLVRDQAAADLMQKLNQFPRDQAQSLKKVISGIQAGTTALPKLAGLLQGIVGQELSVQRAAQGDDWKNYLKARDVHQETLAWLADRRKHASLKDLSVERRQAVGALAKLHYRAALLTLRQQTVRFLDALETLARQKPAADSVQAREVWLDSLALYHVADLLMGLTENFPVKKMVSRSADFALEWVRDDPGQLYSIDNQAILNTPDERTKKRAQLSVAGEKLDREQALLQLDILPFVLGFKQQNEAPEKTLQFLEELRTKFPHQSQQFGLDLPYEIQQFGA